MSLPSAAANANAQAPTATLRVQTVPKKGCYTTLGEALKDAPAGAWINVAAGTYIEGNIVCERPGVRVCADGDGMPILRSNGNTLLVSASTCHFQGLHFVSDDTKEFAVVVVAGSAKFIKCTIQSLLVDGDANPMVENCTITGSPHNGLTVSGAAGGAYFQNQIRGHGLYGVTIDSCGSPSFVSNQISQTECGAVVIWGRQSTPTFKINNMQDTLPSGRSQQSIAANAAVAPRHVGTSAVVALRAAVVIANGAAPTLDGNTLFSGNGHGILVVGRGFVPQRSEAQPSGANQGGASGSGGAAAAFGAAAPSALSASLPMGAAPPQPRKGRPGNTGAGGYGHAAATPSASAAAAAASGSVGSGGVSQLLRNTIRNNRGIGLCCVFGGCRVSSEGNTIESNDGGGVNVEKGCTVSCRKDMIRCNGVYGARSVDASSSLSLVDCEVAESTTGLLAEGVASLKAFNTSIKSMVTAAHVASHGMAELDTCDVSNNDTGVLVESFGHCIVKASVLQSNSVGLLATKHGVPVVARSTFRRNFVAVHSTLGATGSVTDCTIAESSTTQVLVTDRGNTSFENNEIRDAACPAVVCRSSGRGFFSFNRFANHKAPTVRVESNADPHFEQNTMELGAAEGVVVEKQGLGLFVGNRIIGFPTSGVVCKAGADPTFRGNTITHNSFSGLHIQEGSRGCFEKNSLRDNTKCNVHVGGGGNAFAAVCKNTIEASHVGVIGEAGGAALIYKNVISLCTIGVSLSAGGLLHVVRNDLWRNVTGVSCSDEATKGHFIANWIHDSTECGILVRLQANPLFWLNTVMGHCVGSGARVVTVTGPSGRAGSFMPGSPAASSLTTAAAAATAAAAGGASATGGTGGTPTTASHPTAASSRTIGAVATMTAVAAATASTGAAVLAFRGVGAIVVKDGGGGKFLENIVSCNHIGFELQQSNATLLRNVVNRNTCGIWSHFVVATTATGGLPSSSLAIPAFATPEGLNGRAASFMVGSGDSPSPPKPISWADDAPSSNGGSNGGGVSLHPTLKNNVVVDNSVGLAVSVRGHVSGEFNTFAGNRFAGVVLRDSTSSLNMARNVWCSNGKYNLVAVGSKGGVAGASPAPGSSLVAGTSTGGGAGASLAYPSEGTLLMPTPPTAARGPTVTVSAPLPPTMTTASGSTPMLLSSSSISLSVFSGVSSPVAVRLGRDRLTLARCLFAVCAVEVLGEANPRIAECVLSGNVASIAASATRSANADSTYTVLPANVWSFALPQCIRLLQKARGCIVDCVASFADDGLHVERASTTIEGCHFMQCRTSGVAVGTGFVGSLSNCTAFANYGCGFRIQGKMLAPALIKACTSFGNLAIPVSKDSGGVVGSSLGVVGGGSSGIGGNITLTGSPNERGGAGAAMVVSISSGSNFVNSAADADGSNASLALPDVSGDVVFTGVETDVKARGETLPVSKYTFPPTDGAGVGVFVDGSGLLLGEGIASFGNGLANIVFCARVRSIVTKSQFYSSDGYGIVFRQGATGEVRDSFILDNVYAGVLAEPGSSGVITSCTLHGNAIGCLGAGDTSAFSRCTFHNNRICALRFLDGSQGTVSDSEITKCGCGVECRYNAQTQPTIEFNDIHSNTYCGVLCTGGSRPVVRSNKITNHSGMCGVMVRCSATPALTANQIENNHFGIVTRLQGNPSVEGNLLRANDVAIVSEWFGVGSFFSNKFTANPEHSVVVRTGGDGAFHQNLFFEDTPILVTTEGKGSFDNNTFKQPASSCFIVVRGGAPRIFATKFTGLHVSPAELNVLRTAFTFQHQQKQENPNQAGNAGSSQPGSRRGTEATATTTATTGTPPPPPQPGGVSVGLVPSLSVSAFNAASGGPTSPLGPASPIGGACRSRLASFVMASVARGGDSGAAPSSLEALDERRKSLPIRRRASLARPTSTDLQRRRSLVNTLAEASLTVASPHDLLNATETPSGVEANNNNINDFSGSVAAEVGGVTGFEGSTGSASGRSVAFSASTACAGDGVKSPDDIAFVSSMFIGAPHQPVVFDADTPAVQGASNGGSSGDSGGASSSLLASVGRTAERQKAAITALQRQLEDEEALEQQEDRRVPIKIELGGRGIVTRCVFAFNNCPCALLVDGTATKPTIENNLFVGQSKAAAVLCSNHSTPILRRNFFLGNKVGLLLSRTVATVLENYFMSNMTGVECGISTTSHISQCKFLDDNLAVNCISGSSPRVTHNSFFHCDNGAFFEVGSSPKFEDNVLCWSRNFGVTTETTVPVERCTFFKGNGGVHVAESGLCALNRIDCIGCVGAGVHFGSRDASYYSSVTTVMGMGETAAYAGGSLTGARMTNCGIGLAVVGLESSPNVQDSTFYHCMTGVEVSQSGSPKLTGCKISYNDVGVSVVDHGLGVFKRCELMSNRVALSSDSGGNDQPCFSHCNMFDSVAVGVELFPSARGQIVDCAIFDNALGVVFHGTAATTIAHTVISHPTSNSSGKNEALRRVESDNDSAPIPLGPGAKIQYDHAPSFHQLTSRLRRIEAHKQQTQTEQASDRAEAGHREHEARCRGGFYSEVAALGVDPETLFNALPTQGEDVMEPIVVVDVVVEQSDSANGVLTGASGSGADEENGGGLTVDLRGSKGPSTGGGGNDAQRTSRVVIKSPSTRSLSAAAVTTPAQSLPSGGVSPGKGTVTTILGTFGREESSSFTLEKNANNGRPSGTLNASGVTGPQPRSPKAPAVMAPTNPTTASALPPQQQLLTFTPIQVVGVRKKGGFLLRSPLEGPLVPPSETPPRRSLFPVSLADGGGGLASERSDDDNDNTDATDVEDTGDDGSASVVTDGITSASSVGGRSPSLSLLVARQSITGGGDRRQHRASNRPSDVFSAQAAAKRLKRRVNDRRPQKPGTAANSAIGGGAITPSSSSPLLPRTGAALPPLTSGKANASFTTKQSGRAFGGNAGDMPFTLPTLFKVRRQRFAAGPKRRSQPYDGVGGGGRSRRTGSNASVSVGSTGGGRRGSVRSFLGEDEGTTASGGVTGSVSFTSAPSTRRGTLAMPNTASGKFTGTPNPAGDTTLPGLAISATAPPFAALRNRLSTSVEGAANCGNSGNGGFAAAAGAIAANVVVGRDAPPFWETDLNEAIMPSVGLGLLPPLPVPPPGGAAGVAYPRKRVVPRPPSEGTSGGGTTAAAAGGGTPFAAVPVAPCQPSRLAVLCALHPQNGKFRFSADVHAQAVAIAAETNGFFADQLVQEFHRADRCRRETVSVTDLADWVARLCSVYRFHPHTATRALLALATAAGGGAPLGSSDDGARRLVIGSPIAVNETAAESVAPEAAGQAVADLWIPNVTPFTQIPDFALNYARRAFAFVGLPTTADENSGLTISQFATIVTCPENHLRTVMESHFSWMHLPMPELRSLHTGDGGSGGKAATLTSGRNRRAISKYL